jgi:DmsE family decaheme c-type cytochrome
LTRKIVVLGVALAAAMLLGGCETLKSSKPVIPIEEYEHLIVGRLDANYVGTDNCLSACHYHDEIRRHFEGSTMGAQLSSKSGMPLVDCESCHGPGSLAIEGLTPKKVAADRAKGIQTACDYKTFIQLKELPPTAQSLLCLKCHSHNATFNLHNWNAGAHAVAGVSCFNCHDIHKGADLMVSPRETMDMCTQCHQDVKAKLSLRSHHPVKEQRVFCTDCHNPHGTVNAKLLREETVKDTCTRCHGEVEGPFVFEHADVTEDCLRCHRPHGSMNNNLLITQETFLCMQCHVSHNTSRLDTAERRATFYTRCTDCHSQIHGTDIPSASGTGRFIQ